MQSHLLCTMMATILLQTIFSDINLSTYDKDRPSPSSRAPDSRSIKCSCDQAAALNIGQDLTRGTCPPSSTVQCSSASIAAHDGGRAGLRWAQAVEGLLAEFKGVLCVVSHDRAFLEATADRLFVLQGDGLVRLFEGTYSEVTAACPPN